MLRQLWHKSVRCNATHRRIAGFGSSQRATSSSNIGTVQEAAPTSSKVQPHSFPNFDITFIGSGGSNPSRQRGMPCATLFLG
jgi:hypothetical protein